MQSFVDSLIAFLDDKFATDVSISKKPKGHYAYEKGLEPNATTPFYTVQLIDSSLAREDFNREVSNNIAIQINLFGVKMTIGGVLKNAQNVSYYLADKCKAYMNDYKYLEDTKILSMRRTTSSPALPYEDGSKAYFSVLRYNIEIKEN